MSNQPFFVQRWYYAALALALLAFCPRPSRAQLVVDCTGATPGAFTSINPALGASGPGTAIFVVAGPCNENLQLAGWTDLFIGTYYGYPNVAINGGIGVAESHGVYFHGLNITNPAVIGINLNQSQALILDSCNVNGNAANGLELDSASEALVTHHFQLRP